MAESETELIFTTCFQVI